MLLPVSTAASKLKGEAAMFWMIDDYGHHPAEIRATIGAIRESWKRPLIVIFQPHRFSRTQDLFDDFLTAFEGADRLVLTEIYAAGEDPIPGVTGEALYQAIKRQGHMDVEFIADKGQIVQQLVGKLNRWRYCADSGSRRYLQSRRGIGRGAQMKRSHGLVECWSNG